MAIIKRQVQKSESFEHFVIARGLTYERREVGRITSFSISRPVGMFGYNLHVMFADGKRGGKFCGGRYYSIMGKARNVPTERDARLWVEVIKPFEGGGV